MYCSVLVNPWCGVSCVRGVCNIYLSAYGHHFYAGFALATFIIMFFSFSLRRPIVYGIAAIYRRIYYSKPSEISLNFSYRFLSPGQPRVYFHCYRLTVIIIIILLSDNTNTSYTAPLLFVGISLIRYQTVKRVSITYDTYRAGSTPGLAHL